MEGDGEPQYLLTSPADECCPNFSPDGRWLAYASTESGVKQIYVRPFPDVSQARWQVSVNGGWEPLWANGGTELFFRDGEGMKVASVATTPTFSVEAVRPLFSLSDAYLWNDDSRYYAVSPDDRRFLLVRYVQMPELEDFRAGSLVLMENWYSELRQRE